MQFVFQPLTWGFLLVLVPILIHLINLLRHRRQPWAAMEFLLESYRKHRRWVWMKQLLLLLSRMMIMALLVGMLAQWVTGASWLALLGQTTTHHFFLLDDSLSMADRQQGLSAYDHGIRCLASLLQSIANEPGRHQITLLRYSRVLGESLSEVSKPPDKEGNAFPIDSVADLLSRTLPSEPTTLLDPLNNTSPVALDVSPVPALRLIAPLIKSTPNERALVYLISDFREKDWRQPEQIQAALEALKSNQTEFHLIDCVPSSHENLSLVRLLPDQEILAAGVPVMMRVEIRNPGENVQRNISLSIKVYEHASSQAEPRVDRFASGEEQTLPPIVIESIQPGETISRRFQVVFTQSGSQVVRALLPDDALLEDNSIASVLEIVDQQGLLLIDGDDSRRGAFYLNAAFNPGSMARTGWRPTVESPAFLRDASIETLNAFAVIVLANVASLDGRSLANLEAYVQQGGGLALILGGRLNQADYDRYNRDWFRKGEGLLPVELGAVTTLPPPDDNSTSPDMTATTHPIFGPLLGLSNSPFQFVRVSKFVSFAKPQNLLGDSGNPRRQSWQSIIELRDGSPLMIDRGFGQGRVIVLATGLEPSWTNWPQDPTFVVGMLKSMGYLASFRSQEFSETVGKPMSLEYSIREMLPEADVLLPSRSKAMLRTLVKLNAINLDDKRLSWKLAPDPRSQTEDQLRGYLSSGIVEIWNTTFQGTRRTKFYARNAPPAEGELQKISASDLITGLQPIDVKYRTIDSLASTTTLAGLTNRQGLLLALLVMLLLFEQFLAWSASYHLPSRAVAKEAL